jgi:16S rRNA (guanine527-N7)-methyltransferase
MPKPPRSGPETLPSRAARRLRELCAASRVDTAGEAALSRLLVLQATDPTASTTVRDPIDAVDRHVADSLSALEVPQVREARSIADIGSGAGWPGFALAAALPAARVSLVETASRHCRYLERAVDESGLANAEVVHARAEAWDAGLGRHDVVAVRALASLPVLCEYAAPLLREGGVLVAWKGVVRDEEALDGAAAISRCPRSHAARVPQDRSHASSLPTAPRNRDETPPLRDIMSTTSSLLRS